MFRIAHVTDPHVGPLPRPRLRELLNKRITGWVNWHQGRREAHDMEILAALVADIHAQAPEHIACTGDLCNIGLPREWPTARLFLDGLGRPDGVSFVPGNHDAYVPGALDGLLAACAPFVSGDDGRTMLFPYLRRRGPVALIGLSSAVPTSPFVASGTLGQEQLAQAEALLADLGRDRNCLRVILIHHPPHVGGAQPGRGLTDARAFEAMLARAGAELVLHGHNHVGSLAFLAGPRGRIPVIGAPSASARGGALVHRAGYHLLGIDRDRTGFLLTAQLRGLKPDGTIGDLGMLSLNP
jgi:3',5'-cyclic AMP phosphodiesterase CpdA